MIKIGITGQAGFIGMHLFNTLGLYPGKFERIPFEDDYYKDGQKLNDFVSKCDVIVHLAALNRHKNPRVIYNTNILLVKSLIKACEETKSRPHIIFSSSTQEKLNNLYGKSKKEGKELLTQWAIRNNASFSAFVIPNVFGPFGQPYYNSVVATFCHQLTHNEKPIIEKDAELKLIYVGELVLYFMQVIEDVQKMELKGKPALQQVDIPPTTKTKVSGLLQVLESFREGYFGRGEIPDLSSPATCNMWNTFLTYVEFDKIFPFKLNVHADERGSFSETFRTNSGGQGSFSVTAPGITRGNHFHTRKTERFAVIKGKAKIEFRRIGTDKVFTFELDGNQPSFVDMPVWFTHNITNIGEEDLYTVFWINEHFDSNNPDTYFEEV